MLIFTLYRIHSSVDSVYIPFHINWTDCQEYLDVSVSVSVSYAEGMRDGIADRM